MSKVQNLSVTLDNIKFCPYSSTLRLMPGNYWLASFRDNELIFDSFDGKTEEIFKNDPCSKNIISNFVELVRLAIDDEINDYLLKIPNSILPDAVKYVFDIYSNEIGKRSNQDGGYSLGLNILSSRHNEIMELENRVGTI